MTTPDDSLLHRQALEAISKKVQERADSRVKNQQKITPNDIAQMVEEEVEKYNSEPHIFEIVFEGKEMINEQMAAHKISMRRRVMN